MVALRMSRTKIAVGEAVAAVGQRPAAVHVDDGRSPLFGRGPGNVGGEDAILMRIFAVQRDVAAAVGEVQAVHRRDILVGAEARPGCRRLPRTWKPVEIAAQDEVDDARDGVRTVNGRIAAGHDVDALDQIVRDRVDVRRHRVVQDVGGDVAAAVDQHQGALRAEAAQIEQVEAGDADAEAGILLGEGAAQLRQVVQRLTDVGVALLEDALAADRRDRNRRFEVRTADARAGDDDAARFRGGAGGVGGKNAGAGGGLFRRARRLSGNRILGKGRCGKGKKRGRANSARAEQAKLRHL